MVTLSQKLANSGITKSLRNILIRRGRFPDRTNLNWSKSKLRVSKLMFCFDLYLLIFSMTFFSRLSVAGLIPVLLISWKKVLKCYFVAIIVLTNCEKKNVFTNLRPYSNNNWKSLNFNPISCPKIQESEGFLKKKYRVNGSSGCHVYKITMVFSYVLIP